MLHRAGRRLAQALLETNGQELEQAHCKIENARDLGRMAGRIGRKKGTPNCRAHSKATGHVLSPQKLLSF
jgi:hypothetical protein